MSAQASYWAGVLAPVLTSHKLSKCKEQASKRAAGGGYPYPRSTNAKGHSLGIVAGAGAGERRGLLAGGDLPAVSEGVRYKSLCPLEGCGGVYTRFWSPNRIGRSVGNTIPVSCRKRRFRRLTHDKSLRAFTQMALHVPSHITETFQLRHW